MDDENKYIVFKREDFESMVWGNSQYFNYEIKDAVVLRRQDKFASPLLATYAAMIGLVAMEHPDSKKQAELLAIADYFEEQAKLAAEEGHKLPDL